MVSFASLREKRKRPRCSSLIHQVDLELQGLETDWTRPSALGAYISQLDFNMFWSKFGSRRSLYGLFAFVVVACLLNVASPLWLARWTESSSNGLAVYAGIGGLQVCIFWTTNIASFLLTMVSLCAKNWCAGPGFHVSVCPFDLVRINKFKADSQRDAYHVAKSANGSAGLLSNWTFDQYIPSGLAKR